MRLGWRGLPSSRRGNMLRCRSSNLSPIARLRFSPAVFGQPVGEIGRRQLVQAHALRCGAYRQRPVQALGDALHELAAVGLGCRKRASVLLFRRRPRLAASTVSPSATQPGRYREPSPEGRLPLGEAARCGWRSAAISMCYLSGQADFMASLVPQTVTSATS